MPTPCPKCQALSTDDATCSSCGVVFDKLDAIRLNKVKKEREQLVLGIHDSRLPPWLEISFPIFAFLIAPIASFMIGRPFKMWIHEFGHAFMGWFAGFSATPFLGITFYGNQSWITTLCFSILVGLLGYLSWQKKSPFLVVMFALMFLMQFYFRLGMSHFEHDQARAWGGHGGEFWISALMVMAYHYRLPENTFWIVFRYVVLFVGAMVFYQTMHGWLIIKAGEQDVYFGTCGAFGIRSDLTKLHDDWGWSVSQMFNRYLSLGYICLTAIVINYAVHVVRVIYFGHSPLKDYEGLKTGHFE